LLNFEGCSAAFTSDDTTAGNKFQSCSVIQLRRPTDGNLDALAWDQEVF